MTLYTRLEIKEINEIADQFGLTPVYSPKILSGGSENTNYLIEVDSEKYVLCVCEQKTEKEATELAQLLKHLEANDFNTSKIVFTTKEEPIIVRKNKPIMMRKFIEGKILKDLSPNLLNLIGKELAKLHKIPPPSFLQRQLPYGKESFSKVREYAPDSAFEQWLLEYQDFLSPYFQLDLPKALIHSDLFWSNVIIDKAETTTILIDFEEAANYYRIFDIGMTIIGICGEGETINLENAKHILTGYRSEISLEQDELDALKAFTIYAGVAMTFWRHRNFNYVKPDPKMFDHYIGLKVLVEYLMEQDDDCLIKQE